MREDHHSIFRGVETGEPREFYVISPESGGGQKTWSLSATPPIQDTRTIRQGRQRLNRTRFLFAFSIALLLLSCAGGPLIWNAVQEDGDWPQFRGGPRGSGHAAWAIDPPLKLRWKRKFRRGIRGSPLVIRGTVIVATLGGTIHFLDGRTGASIGKHRTRGSIIGTPALSSGRLLFGVLGASSLLCALDLETGDLLWKRHIGPISSSICTEEDTLFAGTERGHLLAISGDTGRNLWRFTAEGQIRSSPALWANMVFFGSDDDHLYALSKKTGTLVWKRKVDGSICASPAVDSLGVYFGSVDGVFHALDHGSGEVLWSFRTEGPIHSSPAYARHMICFGSSDRNLYALDLRSGELLWTFESEGVITSAPALTEHTVYVGSADRSFYALTQDAGEMIWRYEAEATIRSSPAFGPKEVYLGTADGTLYAFEPETFP